MFNRGAREVIFENRIQEFYTATELDSNYKTATEPIYICVHLTVLQCYSDVQSK